MYFSLNEGNYSAFQIEMALEVAKFRDYKTFKVAKFLVTFEHRRLEAALLDNVLDCLRNKENVFFPKLFSQFPAVLKLFTKQLRCV